MSKPVGGRQQLEETNCLVRRQAQQLQQELGELLDHLEEQTTPLAGSVEHLVHSLLHLVDTLVDYQPAILRAAFDETGDTDGCG
jgi:hypothetical protein